MAPSIPQVLCRYLYDPLDRLAGTLSSGQASVQRFYQKDRLATEIHGAMQHTVVRLGHQLLAQQRSGTGTETSLLATDQQSSVLQVLGTAGKQSQAYLAYGYHPVQSGQQSLLAFNGERRDPVTGHYLLGNGYRAFNPVLMRFNSPDSLSPFEKGGINAYAYCSADPVNGQDPSGTSVTAFAGVLKKPLKRLGRTAQHLPGAVSRRREFRQRQNTTVLSLYPGLDNIMSPSFEAELQRFQAAIVDDPFQALVINTVEDLKRIPGRTPRRFVFSSKGDLVVDSSIDLERRGMNHAILASYTSAGSKIIAAGMIEATAMGRVRLWNDSGHFHPDFSTLQSVALRLEGLGLNVERIRAIGSRS